VKALGKGGGTQIEVSTASPREEGSCFMTEKNELHEYCGGEALARFSLSQLHHIAEEKA